MPKCTFFFFYYVEMSPFLKSTSLFYIFFFIFKIIYKKIKPIGKSALGKPTSHFNKKKWDTQGQGLSYKGGICVVNFFLKFIWKKITVFGFYFIYFCLNDLLLVEITYTSFKIWLNYTNTHLVSKIILTSSLEKVSAISILPFKNVKCNNISQGKLM